MAKEIEETLFENPPHLVLHWDSKLLPSVAHGCVKSLEDIVAVPVALKGTGLIQGACTRIEREFGRILLWLACRHHTHELILKGVFEECCGIPSSGLDIQSFRKFQSVWASLDKKSYTTMLDEESPVQGFLEEERVKMVNYIQNVLKDGNHPREDYKELLQLSLEEESRPRRLV
ncbi:hypothetical protein AVEN_130347-1 [Araneus ventricosus]|uniref:Uncharacterized protein n=1 Tax=Araneus ventricosus TaxID=182803 RepID=A0A4Y2BD44_ARAVE|nr:hypothetical protein AVEN_130347-1 [Araneus ventricosus]